MSVAGDYYTGRAAIRQRIADLEAALRELVRLNTWKDELDAAEEADPHEGADGRFGKYWQQDADAWAAARKVLEEKA